MTMSSMKLNPLPIIPEACRVQLYAIILYKKNNFIYRVFIVMILLCISEKESFLLFIYLFIYFIPYVDTCPARLAACSASMRLYSSSFDSALFLARSASCSISSWSRIPEESRSIPSKT